MKITELEQTAALQILIHLNKHGKASRTDLRNAIDASNAAIYNALPKLKKLQLITEKTQNTFPFTVEVALTEKGRKIATSLDQIEKTL